MAVPPRCVRELSHRWRGESIGQWYQSIPLHQLATPKAASEWVGSLGEWRLASISPDGADTYVFVTTIVQLLILYARRLIVDARYAPAIFAALLPVIFTMTRRPGSLEALSQPRLGASRPFSPTRREIRLSSFASPGLDVP